MAVQLETTRRFESFQPEQRDEFLGKLKAEQAQLAETTREFVRSQTPLWQLLPSLASEAEGIRLGSVGSNIVKEKLLPISAGHNVYAVAYIGLSSGEILDAYDRFNDNNPARSLSMLSRASDEAILDILANSPSSFDAASVIKVYLKGIEIRRSLSRTQGNEEVKEQIKIRREKYGLRELDLEQVKQLVEKYVSE